MPCKKILITGASGYLGSHLFQALSNKDYIIVGTDIEVDLRNTDSHQLDITDAYSVNKLMKEVNPDMILHTAGLKNLKQCETNPELAYKVNTKASMNLFHSAIENNPDTHIVFFSSDYVFDGSRGTYIESDATCPKTVYGKSKQKAEKELIELHKKHLIIRTSNVFGYGNGGFFRYVQDRLNNGIPVEAYGDTYFTPTYLPFLIETIVKAIEFEKTGIIHICGKERISRFEFAKLIASFTKQEHLVRKVNQPKEGEILGDSSLQTEQNDFYKDIYYPLLRQAIAFEYELLLPPYMYYADGRGIIQGISNSFSWKEVNLIQTHSDEVRGGHYHKQTTELLVICSGRVDVLLESLCDSKVFQFEAGSGDTVLIKPWFKHTVKCLENTIWVNLLDKPMGKVKKDIYI